MTIAGGIMGALFHRERTGVATIVDVSLLGTGLWAMGQAIALSLVLDRPWAPPPVEAMGQNPLTRNYDTKDGRVLAFTCLQAGKYWPLLCRAIDRPELATDERFADHQSLLAHNVEAIELLVEVFGSRTLEEWRSALAHFEGQWAVVQDTLETAVDPQTVANGYLQECETAAGVPFRLVAAPVQFDGQPSTPGRAPEFNEHGDAVLAELGLDEEAILNLKIAGVVA
jgi:crotonobetainyl-CoA:carnitine CoA-transferase CaiB-like acyl-CoA transferase